MEAHGEEERPLLTSTPQPRSGLLLASSQRGADPANVAGGTAEHITPPEPLPLLSGRGDGFPTAVASGGEGSSSIKEDEEEEEKTKPRSKQPKRREYRPMKESEVDLEQGRSRGRKYGKRKKRKSRRGLDDADEFDGLLFDDDAVLMEDSLDASELRDSRQLTPKHIFYNYYSTGVTWDQRQAEESRDKLSVRLRALAIGFVARHKLELMIACVFLFILFLLRISVWQTLEWEGWYTIFVVAVTFYLLIKNTGPTDVIMIFSTTLLLIPNVITPSEALAGLSSVGIMTIAALFVVAAGIAETGSISLISEWILGKTTSIFLAQLRLMLPLSFLSAFTNNTPLTAIMIPVIEKWCRQTGVLPSKMMIPLSYATIFGGTCTIVGTSTNLIVIGMVTQINPALHFPFFEIGYVGVPIVIVGLSYILLLSQILLPDRQSPIGDMLTEPRKYTITAAVEHNSAVDGKTVGAVGLDHIEGLILVNLIRRGVSNPNVSSETTLRSGDQLVFIGNVSKVTEIFSITGIKPTNQEDKLIHPSIERVLVEAVISPTGSLVNKTIGNINFEERYRAAVLAVEHEGQSITTERLSSITLRGGDALLLVCHPDMPLGQQSSGHESGDFITVSRVGGPSGQLSLDYERMIFAPLLAVIMIIVSTLEITNLLTASLCTAFLMIITRCISVDKAVAASNFRLIVMIAASFGMALAVEKTGVASRVAHGLVSVFIPAGTFGLLYGVYLSTALLTALLSNASAAAMMVPIVFSLPSDLIGSSNIKAFVYCIMVAASADFSTPIGYQTNLMVWGPGGYKFMDYARIGLPLQIMLSIVSVTIIYWQFA